MASYNLLNENWIPVINQQGQRELLGIREVLRRAHELMAVSDASPLVEYGLYRFLGLFLMDALRPEDIFALEDLLDAGQFDMTAIDEYICICQNEGVSFDLFDKERPFLQSAYDEAMDSKARKPIQVLDYTVPRGNNHIHFDHRNSQDIALSYGEAAGLIIVKLVFSIQEGKGYFQGVNGSPPYYSIINGENLFVTLCYTLVPLEFIDMPFDIPPVLWRMKDKVRKENVFETSWLLGMLFPTRRITLIPDEEENCVREVYFSPGMNYVSKEAWTDPNVAYRYTHSGRKPMRPSKDKAIWQNLYELCDVPREKKPLALYVYRELERGKTANITLYGAETNKAKYLKTMRYTLTIPVNISKDADRIRKVKELISAAESVKEKLEKSLVSEINPKNGKKEIVYKVVPQTVVSEAVQIFYDKCEQQLWETVFGALSEETVSADELQKIYTTWIDLLCKNAMEAHSAAVQRLSVKGTTLAEIAKKERHIYAKIHELKEGLV